MIKKLFLTFFILQFAYAETDNQCLNSPCPLETKQRNPIDVFKEVHAIVEQELKANPNTTDECRSVMGLIRDAKVIDGENNKVNTAENVSKVISDFPTLIEKGCFRDGAKAVEIGLHLFDSVGRNLVQANNIQDFSIGPWTLTANAAGVIISGVSRLGLAIMKWMGLQKKERAVDDPLKEIVAAKHQENLMQTLCDYRKLTYLYDQNKLNTDEIDRSKILLQKVEDSDKEKEVEINNHACQTENGEIKKIAGLGANLGEVVSFSINEADGRKLSKACNDFMEVDKKEMWMNSISDLLCRRLDCKNSHQACQFIPALVELKVFTSNEDGNCQLNPNWKKEISCFDISKSGREKVLNFVSNLQLLSDAIPSAVSSIKENSGMAGFLKLSEDRKLLKLQSEQIKSQLEWQDSIHRNSTEMSLRGLSQFLLNTPDTGFQKYISEKNNEITAHKENAKSKIYNIYEAIDEETDKVSSVENRLVDDINYMWMQYSPARDHVKKVKKVCETFLSPCAFKTKSNRFTSWLSSNQTIEVEKTTLETSNFEKACLGYDYKNPTVGNFCEFFKEACKSEGRGSKSPEKYQSSWDKIKSTVEAKSNAFDPDFIKALNESKDCNLKK